MLKKMNVLNISLFSVLQVNITQVGIKIRVSIIINIRNADIMFKLIILYIRAILHFISLLATVTLFRRRILVSKIIVNQ